MTAIDYDNKVFLAPMVRSLEHDEVWEETLTENDNQVRIGTLPFRLTALEYGAGTIP